MRNRGRVRARSIRRLRRELGDRVRRERSRSIIRVVEVVMVVRENNNSPRRGTLGSGRSGG